MGQQIKVLKKLFMELDLVNPLSYPKAKHYKAYESNFASHVHELHKRISDRVLHKNANYELRAGIGKRVKTLNVGLSNSCRPVVLNLLKS